MEHPKFLWACVFWWLGMVFLKWGVGQNGVGKSVCRSQILADFMVIGSLKPWAGVRYRCFESWSLEVALAIRLEQKSCSSLLQPPSFSLTTAFILWSRMISLVKTRAMETWLIPGVHVVQQARDLASFGGANIRCPSSMFLKFLVWCSFMSGQDLSRVLT